ncbi:hypothetical protein, partial [Flavobacterium sp. AG291]|uniref:hypothetical protein n=1 Tax=Flavobacterium sp. AG291 TaxID=2184000 RepID=UPI001F3B86A6
HAEENITFRRFLLMCLCQRTSFFQLIFFQKKKRKKKAVHKLCGQVKRSAISPKGWQGEE